jgi:hypothetical protein
MVSMWDVAVNNARNSNETQTEQSAPRPIALIVLLVILALEGLALAGSTVFFAVELFARPSSSVASAVALVVIVGAATVWVAFVVRGVLLRQAWTRAAVVVLQILIIAVGVGSVQGPSPRPDLAAALIVPALLALVLLFTRSVVAATGERSPLG